MTKSFPSPFATTDTAYQQDLFKNCMFVEPTNMNMNYFPITSVNLTTLPNHCRLGMSGICLRLYPCTQSRHILSLWAPPFPGLNHLHVNPGTVHGSPWVSSEVRSFGLTLVSDKICRCQLCENRRRGGGVSMVWINVNSIPLCNFVTQFYIACSISTMTILHVQCIIVFMFFIRVRVETSNHFYCA